ncbi:MAG: sigma-70 family RNA polymerase sigma factor, partial [Candidatus Omnitrophica bacterium]|nr:sigma-70 family RNA polymerase sigma factor [Candidatus Omnitrophota bacterium]
MNIREIIELDDEKLVKMVQDENDILAFETLVKRYQNMVYNVCFRFMADQQDAFDCAQDSFIRVYENIKAFKHLSSFKTWLYRIAVNICKNRLQSLGYRRRKKTGFIEDK